jgi:hypothetical protein
MLASMLVWVTSGWALGPFPGLGPYPGPFPEVYGPAAFGVYGFESSFNSREGLPVTQAAFHPYAWTTTIALNHEVESAIEEKVGNENPIVHANNYGDPKHFEVRLPEGMVVNPQATSVKCTEAQLEAKRAADKCPSAAAVGIAAVYTGGIAGQLYADVYNMVPPRGVPAELGFDPGEAGVVAHVLGKVRTGEDYGLSGEVSGIGQEAKIYGAKITLWGNPTDASHDPERGLCALSRKVTKTIEEEKYRKAVEEAVKNGTALPQLSEYDFSCPVERLNKPLLTMPSSCTGNELTSMMSTYSWQEPGNIVEQTASSPAMSGCEEVAFHPSIRARPEPEGVASESPSGLDFDLKIPREESVGGLAEADLRNATVTLPGGVAVSPSAANGLQGCTPDEIGLHNANEPSCPDASKVGEVEVITPLLEAPLKGGVYVAQQGTFEGALIGLYIVAEGQGALVKLGGKVTLDEATGQIKTTFENNPQLPFSELKLRLFGGDRAPLMTPAVCGTYTTTSDLTPWTAPFAPDATPANDEFVVGSSCAGQAFGPSFTAGTANNQAGGYSSFGVTLARQDHEQRLSGVRVTTPPGLLGVLKSVVRCPEPQASKGECGPESEIGETTVAVGPGSDPYWVKGGRVYLTGPYAGAPFGLSIVVPTVAGPFTLTGNGGFGREIVRARVDVDPRTAQIVVTSDPLPTILQGIPLDVRTVNVTVNRPGFMFNPTDCAQLSVTGTLESTTGTKAGVSSPFEAANCANLPFKPSFKVSTPAKTSKAAGAGLAVRVGSGAGQANIAKVRVTLPKQLPARLTTLQKACTEAAFNANPALCPAESVVGTATALTPLLAHPLTGPAYLVSHGGAAFPDLVFVLQGEGILLYLDGNTNIKKGITTSTFNSVPDAPISTFETVFPEGPHSVLATNIPAKAKGSMCNQKLTMPTTITGQNGAVLKQTTKVAVIGCPKKPKPKKKSSGKRKK